MANGNVQVIGAYLEFDAAKATQPDTFEAGWNSALVELGKQVQSLKYPKKDAKGKLAYDLAQSEALERALLLMTIGRED